MKLSNNRTLVVFVGFIEEDNNLGFYPSARRGLVANDYSPISKEGTPHTLEITFSANANISKLERKYPQEIDQPNNPAGQNIRLIFKDK